MLRLEPDQALERFNSSLGPPANERFCNTGLKKLVLLSSNVPVEPAPPPSSSTHHPTHPPAPPTV